MGHDVADIPFPPRKPKVTGPKKKGCGKSTATVGMVLCGLAYAAFEGVRALVG